MAESVDTLGFLKNAVLESERKAKEYAKPIKRDLYGEIAAKPNLHIVYGLRGGGKTTLLFQRFFDYEAGRRVYIACDELRLLRISIYEVFRNLHYVIDIQNGALFLDEITRLDNWAEELKIGCDAHPNLAVYVSGSSSIDLLESKRALARRAKYHSLLPMTFREFLRIAHGIELKPFNLFSQDLYTEILRYDIYFKEKMQRNPLDIVAEYTLKSHPFLLEADQEMLKDLVEKIVYEDIAKVYHFGSDILNKFERLLFLLAMSEKITYDNVSKDLQISKAVVGNMLRALLQSGLIRQILPYGGGRVVGRKTWRYFFTVPAARKLYMEKGGAEPSRMRGYLREDLFVSHLQDIFYLPDGADFVYKGLYFEIGGKTKTFAQLQGVEKGFVVYDGLEIFREGHRIKFPFYIFLSHL